MKDLRIIFMGTPDFATGVLQRMVEAGLQVVAVVTVADKPAGRGQRLQESSVKKYALSQQIPVLQPISLRDEGFLAQLKVFQADVQVVVAFRMLPRVLSTYTLLYFPIIEGQLLSTGRLLVERRPQG